MVKVYAITSVGPVREKNQDGFYVNGLHAYECPNKDVYYESSSNKLLAFVCDGVGSTEDGEYAVEKTIKYFKNHEEKLNPGSISNAINAANTFICSSAEFEHKTCATTIAGVYVDSDITAFNVGDSKIYSVNNGYLEEISKDDTVAEMIRESSEIDDSKLDLDKKLPLIQYLGNPDSQTIDTHITTSISLKDIMICSDGITDMVSIDDIEDIIEAESDIKTRVNMIAEKAVANGGYDNLTLIYISFE